MVCMHTSIDALPYKGTESRRLGFRSRGTFFDNNNNAEVVLAGLTDRWPIPHVLLLICSPIFAGHGMWLPPGRSSVVFPTFTKRKESQEMDLGLG